MRRMRDLPWQGKRVEIHLQARRFRCRNNACDRKIFAERLPDLLASVQRLIAPLERWTEKEQTQAEVEVFILDRIYESLPSPPFDDDEKQETLGSHTSISGSRVPLGAISIGMSA
jgi:hypothetical protein